MSHVDKVWIHWPSRTVLSVMKRLEMHEKDVLILYYLTFFRSRLEQLPKPNMNL